MKILKPSEFLGTAWWGGLLVGLFGGLFIAAMLVETDALPSSSPAWKFIHAGSALGIVLTSILGIWGMRRAQAAAAKEAGAAESDGVG